jgi:hypothetical protein
MCSSLSPNSFKYYHELKQIQSDANHLTASRSAKTHANSINNDQGFLNSNNKRKNSDYCGEDNSPSPKSKLRRFAESTPILKFNSSPNSFVSSASSSSSSVSFNSSSSESSTSFSSPTKTSDSSNNQFVLCLSNQKHLSDINATINKEKIVKDANNSNAVILELTKVDRTGSANAHESTDESASISSANINDQSIMSKSDIQVSEEQHINLNNEKIESNSQSVNDDVIWLKCSQSGIDSSSTDTEVDAKKPELAGDSFIKEQIILNLKVPADPSINLSKCNYKYKLNNKTDSHYPFEKRKFRSDIFKNINWNVESENNKENQPNEENKQNYYLQKDKNSLAIKLKEIANKRDRLHFAYKEIFDNNFEYLKKIHTQQLGTLRHYPNRQHYIQIINQSYQQTLEVIRRNFTQKANETTELANSEMGAVNEYFLQGSYKPGQFEKYQTIPVLQPQAIRRNYKDNGQRWLVMHVDEIENFLIEEQLYFHYYGVPK